MESTEVILYGFVDAKKMWDDFEALNEPYVPVLVGGKAVVTIWFNNFTDTDCGGAYLETWYNTFVTPKGEPQLELPAENGPIIQDPRALSYLQRVLCSEHEKPSGAGKVAVESGRSIWGFPKHPQLGKITFKYQEDGKKVVFNCEHLGKKAVSLNVDVPQKGAEGVMEVPLELETGPDALISGPRLGGTDKNHNGAHQTRYGVAFKCTQYVQPWNAATDTLEFGDDEHFANVIKRWDFTPILKVHSPDFKIIAKKPSNWKSSAEADEKLKGDDNTGRFTDAWWRQFDKPTGGFVDSSGELSRLPLRLESTEVIVYGRADAKKMWACFEGLDEDYVPVLVGGKAVISVWFNNFTDTDCKPKGVKEKGAYLETWYNTFVTKKGEPQLELPYDTPFSTLIQDPRSISYLQRVLCSEHPEKKSGAGAGAVDAGRSIWGFPKHPELAQILFTYKENKDKKQTVEFECLHQGKKAVSLQVVTPQAGEEGTVEVPLELATGPEALLAGPRLGGTQAGHNGCQQTKYGVAFKCTQHVRPWDPSTDKLEFGDNAHFSPIKGWDFEPVLKVHSPDFKITARAPANWVSAEEAAKFMKQ